MGFFVLFFLTTLSLLAGLSVAGRMGYPSRAECLLAGSMIASALILAVVHTTGFLGVLRAPVLAAASLALFSAVLAVSLVRAKPGHLRASALDLLLPFRLPAEALAITWRSRSFAFLGVLSAILLLLYTAWLSYLAPSDGWDGIRYHETMIGYAIQEHGYAMVPLNPGLIHVHTFPRNCEMTSLWFVIFWDRRLVDIVNNFYSLPVGLALFQMIRRYERSMSMALGWTSSLFLIPGYQLQLHSNYIDIHTVAFFLAGLNFGTRPGARIRDVLLASTCFGLLLGAKSFAIAWTPVLCFATVLVLLFRHVKARPRAVALTVVAGILLIVANGGPIYIRNWVVFKNPIHPYHYDSKTRKISSPELGNTEFHKELKAILVEILDPPAPGYDYVDTRKSGYGLAMPFLLLPMSVIALAYLAFRWVRDLAFRRAGDRAEPEIQSVAVTLLPLLGTFFLSPALEQARYNYPLIAGVLILLAWFLAPLRRYAESTFAVAIVTGWMWIYWAKPAWLVDFNEAKRLARLSAAERATQTTFGWSIGRETAAAREKLGPLDTVVYSDDIEFPAVLWNETYSNRVLYLPRADFTTTQANLDAVNATWFITSEQAAQFDASPNWKKVGPVSGRPVFAYARAPGTR